MAKRRTKKRTHVGARPSDAPSKPGSRTPKSMVIRIGASHVGPSVTQLVHDVRSVLEPQTATRLKERRNNKLRDYTTMAGPLGVTHLLLFSRNEASGNVNMRLAVTPRGPTMHFRVEAYSLCKDVAKSLKRPKAGGVNGEYLAPPLLVMNNFVSKPPQEGESNGPAKKGAVPKHLETLATTVFQSLFPPINPTQTPLKSIKRVLLLDRQTQPPLNDSDPAPYVLNLRHYAIETRTAKSVPKPLRRLDAAEKLAGQKRKRGGVPNLAKLNDVADYLLDPHAADGFTSASDSEPETDAEVEVLAPTSQRVRDHRRAKKGVRNTETEDGEAPARERNPDRKLNGERKGVKMHELGPRLRMRLTKVEEGLCGGKVMWHEYIHKTDAEIREMEKTHQQRRAERERRKKEQKENVERKKKEKKANGEEGVEDEEDAEMDDDDDVWADYDEDEDMEDMEDGGAQVDGEDEEEE